MDCIKASYYLVEESLCSQLLLQEQECVHPITPRRSPFCITLLPHRILLPRHIYRMRNRADHHKKRHDLPPHEELHKDVSIFQASASRVNHQSHLGDSLHTKSSGTIQDGHSILRKVRTSEIFCHDFYGWLTTGVDDISSFQALPYILFWTLMSCSVILFNKRLYSGRFTYPITLTSIHMAFASVITMLMRWQGSLSVPTLSIPLFLKRVLPIGVLFAASLAFSNLAVVRLSVPFVQVSSKALEWYFSITRLISFPLYRCSNLLRLWQPC